MNMDLNKKKKEANSDLVKFLSILFESTGFHGSIALDKVVNLVAEKTGLTRFEVLALYYRAKRRALICVECFRDPRSSLKTYVSMTGKGVRALMEVTHK